jgi:ketosteroid isomerase-like protein
MKERSMRVRVATLGALALASAACARSRDTDVAAEASRIRMLEQQSFLDLAARRMDAVSALYARDARMLRADAPTVVGHDSIAVVFHEMAVALPQFRNELTTDSVVVARGGEMAVATGRYRFTPDTLHPSVFEVGKYLGVWKREDGQWRIALDMTNSDGTGTAPAMGDAAAVREVVEAYLHGLKFNDVASLRRAFWPEARLFFVDRDGHLGQLTQSRWYGGFAAVAGHEEEGELRIASLTVTRDIASVTVVEEYPRSRYTDYLSLVKFDSGWRIVNKVYTSEPRTP